jgi:hypothetical protein
MKRVPYARARSLYAPIIRLAPFLVLLCLCDCAVTPPRNPDDICAIFREKRHWYHVAVKQETKWGISPAVPMSILYQESGFHRDLHTQRTYFLWVIPWGYVTSAYGYPQAETGVWRDYEKRVGDSADREDFADSIDFVNWYITTTSHQNRVPVTNAYAQYLNYHEGWYSYRARTYLRKPWLMSIAHKVNDRARRYARQYAACKQSLRDRGFWNWLF